MKWFVWFPLAVVGTSLALVAALILTGGVLVGNALASGPFGGKTGFGPWSGLNVPPELTGLRDLTPDQRFEHFKGVEVHLTDKDNRPVTLRVTPGTATAVSSNSITISGNDGATHTFGLNDKTVVRGTTGAINANDKVIVISMDNAADATAVVNVNAGAFGPHDWRHS
jgi:hypothetical protein